jgi:hypothetical protein
VYNGTTVESYDLPGVTSRTLRTEAPEPHYLARYAFLLHNKSLLVSKVLLGESSTMMGLVVALQPNKVYLVHKIYHATFTPIVKANMLWVCI